MSLHLMSWIPRFRLFINYIIFKKIKKGKKENEKATALPPFLYSAIILYNNNVPKIIIYIFQIIAGGGNDLLLPVRKLCTISKTDG